MADTADAAAAAVSTANDNANDDDVEDLYADLDEQVAAALAAAGESGSSNARDSDPATDGEVELPEADANEAVDLGDGTAGYSSSDEESDDGLHIVLNEDAGAPPPPPSAGRGDGCVAEGEEGEDSGTRLKPSVNDSVWGKIGGIQCNGPMEKPTAPIIGQGDRGRQHVFQGDYNFFLPRNSSIFDINIEAFQQKPWRQQGVDLTDYFNFSLNEESWRKYWLSMKQLRKGARSLANETSGLDQGSYKLEHTEAMPKLPNCSGLEGRNGLAKPKGRAIHVRGSVCERVPSADVWRPIQRDSDVVIQVNMTVSPSINSTSDDSSTVNYKCVTTERTSNLKHSSFVVHKAVDEEVDDGASSECTGSKMNKRDSSCARNQSSSPDYSDTLSEESKKDFSFRRAHRRSGFRDFYEDTKLQDEHVKSGFYHHSSKPEKENSGIDSHSSTPPPAGDRNHNAAKLLWKGEAPFAVRGKSSEFLIDYKSNRRLLKSRHKARKEHERPSLCGVRRAVVEKEKSTQNYRRRYDGEYEQRRSISTSLRANYHNAVNNQLYDKQDYSPLKRVALRNDDHYFSNDSNHHDRRSWREMSEGEDVVKCFPSAKEWQQHHDPVYHGMLEADISDDDDGGMYRERFYQERRRGRHGNNVDDEFLHYSDYRFSKLQSPEARGEYRNKGRFAKSNYESLRHPSHLELYPQANEDLKSSERDWPAAGLLSIRSRNRCMDNKRIQNAKIVQYHCDGYHQKNKHHDSSFHTASVPQSSLRTDAFAKTGCILPVKRKIHADLGSMNCEDLADMSLLKERRLMHDQSMVSDRKIYTVKLHKFTKGIDTEAICTSSDMRNSNNVCVERRHELENADNIHLNDRKTKFERRGNVLRRVIESGHKGRLPVGKGLLSSKHMHAHQNVQIQNMGYPNSGNWDLEKSGYQNQQNEDEEIEEGELIEQDHRAVISKSKLNEPRSAVLKSVVGTSSAEQSLMDNAMPKDAACSNGVSRKCDDRRILEIIEKMQKRRERFKEAIATKKEPDGDNKELLAVACSTDDIQNQRPARKRRWGGNG